MTEGRIIPDTLSNQALQRLREAWEAFYRGPGDGACKIMTEHVEGADRPVEALHAKDRIAALEFTPEFFMSITSGAYGITKNHTPVGALIKQIQVTNHGTFRIILQHDSFKPWDGRSEIPNIVPPEVRTIPF